MCTSESPVEFKKLTYVWNSLKKTNMENKGICVKYT